MVEFVIISDDIDNNIVVTEECHALRKINLTFDSGMVLNGPVTGHWMIPPKFFDYVDRTKFFRINKKKRQSAFKTAMKHIDSIPIMNNMKEEYTHFCEYYRIFFQQLPEIKVNSNTPNDIAKEDKILDVRSLIDCGVQWAGESNPKDYLISPLFGNFTGLPPITSFVGTSEIFLPDCELLHTRLDKSNIKNTLKKYNKIQHVFPALPVPEAKKALQEIVGIIGK